MSGQHASTPYLDAVLKRLAADPGPRIREWAERKLRGDGPAPAEARRPDEKKK